MPNIRKPLWPTFLLGFLSTFMMIGVIADITNAVVMNAQFSMWGLTVSSLAAAGWAVMFGLYYKMPRVLWCWPFFVVLAAVISFGVLNWFTYLPSVLFFGFCLGIEWMAHLQYEADFKARA